MLKQIGYIVANVLMLVNLIIAIFLVLLSLGLYIKPLKGLFDAFNSINPSFVPLCVGFSIFNLIAILLCYLLRNKQERYTYILAIIYYFYYYLADSLLGSNPFATMSISTMIIAIISNLFIPLLFLFYRHTRKVEKYTPLGININGDNKLKQIGYIVANVLMFANLIFTICVVLLGLRLYTKLQEFLFDNPLYIGFSILHLIAISLCYLLRNKQERYTYILAIIYYFPSITVHYYLADSLLGSNPFATMSISTIIIAIISNLFYPLLFSLYRYTRKVH